jgi:hypothetical protein
MMKRLIFAILLTGGAMAATADNYDYPYLTFENSDGSATSVSVESLTITVSDGKLVAGDKTFTLASLSNMYFSTEATGIENVNDASQQGEARYYDLQGRMVENPAHGVFIKKVNGKTTKVVLK